MKKKDGSTVLEATVTFSLIIMMILILYVIGLGQIRVESEMASDDIVCSELAAIKEIDKKALGRSPNLDLLVINEPEKAFETFKRHLKNNLNLDDELKPINKNNFIKSKVEILEFQIYNVNGNDVEKISLTNGTFQKQNFVYGKGSQCTPKDNLVENTTLYVKLRYKVNTIFNNSEYMMSAEEVDITKD